MPWPALHQTYAAAVPELSVPWAAEAPSAPCLLWLNEELARELGLDPEGLRTPDGIALLAGQVDGDGGPRAPGAAAPEPPFTTAQAYSGHQFGSPNPRLGDGRAVLLGDLVDTLGNRRDLHLKGSGRTPFARGGDGKAPLGPMLREAIVGESLHALGIPTTRALAVLATGERIPPRQGVVPEPGAILVRVAASHLRVGTVQFAAWHHDLDVRRALVDHAIERHHPAARDAENPPLALLRAVMEAQAELVAQWMLVGFVHGVMNTDNMTLSGEGIDYGPCAFLGVQRRGAVFSSIDREGRYAYGNQPGIALWNLSRFAEALLELIDPAEPDAAVDAATAVLEDFAPRYRRAHARGLAAKLGIATAATAGPVAAGPREAADDAALLEEVHALGEELSALLEAQGIDRTGFFRALAEEAPAEEALAEGAPGMQGDAPADGAAALFAQPAPFNAWREELERLRSRAPAADAEEAVARMLRTNPVHIPRNLALDSALRAAHLGDLGPFEALMDAVRRPFERLPGLEHLERGSGDDDGFVTYCGT
ncbi:protein adenylyltransferase SelO [Brachybacterium sp. DNPG3]